MRLQKTLVETQQFPNGEIQAVLYDNNDKVVRVVMIDEEGEPILSDKERKALGNELKMFETDSPVKAHKLAVKQQQDEYQAVDFDKDKLTDSLTDKLTDKMTIARSKYQKKNKPNVSPNPDLITKDITEEKIDEIVQRVMDKLPRRNGDNIQKSQPSFVERFYKVMGVRKGLLTNLIGIGSIASMLPDKEQNRIDRMMEREVERAERMRDINNKRNSRRNR
jgi:hypothetical protein|tara:strand:+ start:4765 stop:5427 length:663 start_codon:yes stop_codon:yes gene_type:complete